MYSYFIHISKDKLNETAQVKKNLFPGEKMEWDETPFTQILNTHKYTDASNDTTYYLSGKVDNLQKLSVKYGLAGISDPVLLCATLVKKEGWKTADNWKGCFAFFAHDPSKKQIHFTIGNTGLMQGYIIHENGRIMLTSELKAFCSTSSFSRKMIPLDTYHYEYTARVEPGFCFLQDVKRMVPGSVYVIGYKDPGNISLQQLGLSGLFAGELDITKEEAKEKIYELLEENVSDKIKTPPIGIPVSGGLDSGLAASLVHRHTSDLYTYTIGTDFGNEYDNACEVHEFLQSTHKEIHIDNAGFWEGFIQSVWHNEICDPLYAEGYVGFYHVFAHAHEDVSQLFTGYGADLILGDFLLTADRTSINSLSEYWARRTAWTGEMSAYTAQNFGIEIQHPFWETELINFSLSIPYSYKYAGDEVKALLREMAEEKKLLPNSIAWRKKNAFTTGASLDKLFSHCLEIPYEKNYRYKSIFLYYVFEELFVNDTPPGSINIRELMEKTNRYAG